MNNFTELGIYKASKGVGIASPTFPLHLGLNNSVRKDMQASGNITDAKLGIRTHD